MVDVVNVSGPAGSDPVDSGPAARGIRSLFGSAELGHIYAGFDGNFVYFSALGTTLNFRNSNAPSVAPPEVPVQPGQDTVAALPGVHWLLTGVNIDGTAVALSDPQGPFIEFAPGRAFVVHNGTNSMWGTGYSANAHGFDLSNAGGTQAFGMGPPVVGFASLFGAAPGSTHAAIVGPTLLMQRGAITMTFTNADGAQVSGPLTPVVVGVPAADEYVGIHWTLTRVDTGGAVTDLPASLGASFEMTGESAGFDDTINFTSGSYRLTDDGFTLGPDLATTAVGYVGDDPTRLAAITGIRNLVGSAIQVRLDQSGNLLLQVEGTMLTFVRG